MEHYTSERMVRELLHEMGYSLQANRKTQEGGSHPDRNEQFVGDFKNAGQEWRPKKTPEHVRVHDFPIKELGKVSRYRKYSGMVALHGKRNVFGCHTAAYYRRWRWKQ